MSVRNITIPIAGRQYPLQVRPDDEEAIRRAGKLIEDMIANMEKNFAVRDKQDSLSMVCIELASKLENFEKRSKEDLNLIQQEIASISNSL